MICWATVDNYEEFCGHYYRVLLDIGSIGILIVLEVFGGLVLCLFVTNQGSIRRMAEEDTALADSGTYRPERYPE